MGKIRETMNPQQQLRALTILNNLALENKGWKALWRRWYISDEPLRHDASRLLKDIGWKTMLPKGTDWVDP